MNETDDAKAQSPDEETPRSPDDFKMQAMREMGWNINADIPMANAENLQILKEMEEMTELKLKLNQQIKSLDEREKAIQRHKRSIEQALTQNMTLYNTIKSDVLKEEHLFKLAHLERCKVNEDLKRNEKEYEDFKDQNERLQSKICAKKAEIDEMTERIKSSKTALLEWNEAMNEGNKGYELIEKYYKDDQQRARELNTRRQNLQSEIDRRRRTVVAMYDEQNTLEKNLERTATLYRQAHLERRQMVDTWKAAVNLMTQCEMNIQNGEDEYAELLEKSKETREEYQKNEERLNEVIENNRQVEAVIEQVNNDTSAIKEEIQRIADMTALKQKDISALQKEMTNLSNNLEQQRTENRLHYKEKMEKELELENFGEVLKKLEERLAAMENKALSANQRLQILEEMNDNEQKSLNDLSKESERLNDLLFRTREKMNQVKDEEKRLTVNNSALKLTLAATKRNQKGVEKELKRQTEISYNLAFKYLELERRLNNLRGNMVDPEVEENNQKHLAELEQHYAKLQRRMQVTDAQNKKLNHSMYTTVNAYNADNKDLEDAKFRIKEAQVFCEGTVKRLKDREYHNQELIVELNIIKMRCNDMESQIEKCEKGTYDLEQHRLKLQHAVKDRMAELKSQEEVLLLKRKHLAEELSTLRADIGERKKHIETMRARFELTSKLLGTNDDGTLVTTTQLKVQNAQEKELLTAEGDELNKKVLKAEQEIVALENTLRQFDKSNDSYRKTLGKEENTPGEKIEEDLKQLQVEYCKELNEMKLVRCKVQRYEQQLEQLEERRDELQKNYDLARAKHEESLEEFEKLQKELDEQNAKIQRADREIRLALKKLKEKPIGPEFLELFNRDLELQELEQRNLRALNQLSDMAMSDPNGKEIMDLMVNKGLQMPQHLKRTRSVVSWKSESSFESSSYTSKRCSVNTLSMGSDTSSIKEETASSRVSVVSLEFPSQK